MGTNPNVPQKSFQRKWQFKDDIAINHGKHSFKSGFDYLWEPDRRRIFRDRSDAVISFFDDPTTILTNKTEYPEGLPRPARSSRSPRRPPGNPYFDEHNKMFGLYFQDDWKVTRRLIP